MCVSTGNCFTGRLLGSAVLHVQVLETGNVIRCRKIGASNLEKLLKIKQKSCRRPSPAINVCWSHLSECGPTLTFCHVFSISCSVCGAYSEASCDIRDVMSV